MSASTGRLPWRLLTVTLGALALGPAAGGCGGGGGGGGGGVVVNATITPVSSSTDAARFLTQATFGPTTEDVELVRAVGYEYWIEHQALVAPTRHLAVLDARLGGATPPTSSRVDSWWWVAVRGQDQLRQRVAFALSQLLVVSEVDVSGPEHTRALASYYDLLAAHAFGNYRDLLEAVTLSPVMGVYLSHVRNEKAQPARNIRPDENYARELMQLFSIGLVRLNQDGTVQLDGSGDPIPTYDQETIEGYAAVFTGWTYAGTTQWSRPSRNMLQPMIPFEDFHDTASDFGRTLTSNGDGSDHGWGGHYLVMGRPVAGRRIYGQVPSLEIGGPDDTRGGRLIPTTAVDEYASRLAAWFGVTPGEMSTVFPNIGNFDAGRADLGFLP